MVWPPSLIYYWILFGMFTKLKGFKWISYFDVFIIISNIKKPIKEYNFMHVSRVKFNQEILRYFLLTIVRKGDIHA